ncbi:MAG: efflux RND transporter periplasmic adaptor subunit [Rhodospirillaceae bacterium]|nr:efflux RND transporter periplasmic adaptor subunit [Rhodospirillaceae bacterium]
MNHHPNQAANHQASLLGQLKIDRTEGPSARKSWLWWAGGAGMLAVLGLGAWVVLAGPAVVPVQAATARRVVTTGGVGASLLDASGYVVARIQATVSAKITGKVREVLIEEGQRVEKGQVMARLDDSNALAALAQAKAQLAQAEAAFDAARSAFDNIRPIHERNISLAQKGWVSAGGLDQSRAAFDAARSGRDVAEAGLGVAQAAYRVAARVEDDTSVRAPFSGVVTVKAAQPGEMVSPVSAGGGFTRTGIGTVVDMDSLEVEVDVSENFISRVHANQPATIRLNAYPDWAIPGAIIAVIPTADRAKATVKVRVAFKEKDERVVPEMGARVSFLEEGGTTPNAPAPTGVVVPAEAVQGTGDTGVVFIIKDKAVARRVVTLGGRGPDGQVVLSGLSAGDRIAVGDLSKLQDGTKIILQ